MKVVLVLEEVGGGEGPHDIFFDLFEGWMANNDRLFGVLFLKSFFWDVCYIQWLNPRSSFVGTNKVDIFEARFGFIVIQVAVSAFVNFAALTTHIK